MPASTISRVAGLVGGQVATWALTLVWLLTVPRMLGLHDFGCLVVASSVLSVVTSLSLFGLDVHLLRLVARGSRAGLLRAAIGCAVVTCCMLLPATGLVLLALLGPAGLLLSLGYLAQAVGNIAYAVLQGDDRPGLRARWDIAAKAVFLAGSLLVTTLTGVALALALGYVVYALAGWAAVRRYRLVEPGDMAAADIREVLREDAPLGAHLVAQAVYYRSDSMLLSHLRGASAAGVYGAAYRLFDTLSFVTGLFAAVVSSRLVRLVRTDLDGARRLLRLSLLVMTVAGVGGACAVAVTAGPVIRWVFGDDYAGSADLLRVLGVALGLSFVATPLGWALMACDRQARVAAISASAAVVNVVANLLVVPAHGAEGAAWTTVVTEVVVLAGHVRALGGTDLALSWRRGLVRATGTHRVLRPIA